MYKTNLMPTLQEKSASGSVASFNTVLAMPLVSCNIAVNAWQEGSGDPSPVNDRPIHGWTASNLTRAGKNLLPPILNNEQQSIYANGVTLTVNNGKFHIEGLATNSGGRATLRTKNFLLPKGTYYISTDRVGSAIFLQDTSTIIKSGNGTFTLTENTEVYVGFNVVNGTDYNETFYVQLEAGSTATSYEPYVTPTIYTIQLGQEVYGAEVDVVNGVARVEWIKKVIDENSDVIRADNGILYLDDFFDISVDGMSVKCNCYTRGINRSNVSQVMELNNNYSFCCKSGGATDKRVMIKDTRFNTIEEFNEWVALNPISVLIMLAEPFDIQLTPQQIATIRGNNTIFADTGDIDLTYKDLDIAKRGNFREVFKLPS